MKKSELTPEYMEENAFWHITSKLNVESIARSGLVPRDGQRNGENKSAEDKVPRVFFSQGLDGVLEQANNLASIMNDFIRNISKTNTGYDGKDINKKLQEFINSSSNDNAEKNDSKNGGFIDLSIFIMEDAFKNGIDQNLTGQDIDRIVYDIVTTIWKNNVCLKANLKEGIDYSSNDTNYSSNGEVKVPMTKRNMHTFEGHTVTPDKIEIIVDENGHPRTTWDIFKEMAIFYKETYPDKDYLPVEEWESAYQDENGQIIYTGEIKHDKDYLSMFMEMEQSHTKSTQDLGKETLDEQKDTALLDKINEVILSQDKSITKQIEDK